MVLRWGRRPVVVTGALLLLGAVAIVLASRRADSTVLATGSFHQVAHKGVGTVDLVRYDDGSRSLRLSDLRTTFRPDLEVLLISAPDAFENETVRRSEVVSLGPLGSGEGAPEYPIPDHVDLQKYRAVTIWSRKYGVNFTTAPLAWRDGE